MIFGSVNKQGYTYFFIVLGILLVSLKLFVPPEYYEKPDLQTLLIGLAIGLIALSPTWYISRQQKMRRSSELKMAAHDFGWKYTNSLRVSFLGSIANRLGIDTEHPLKSKFVEGMVSLP